MEPTAPQKQLLEMDERHRAIQRAGEQGDPSAQARYYISLLRQGKIRFFDISAAATLGNKAARIAAVSIGEDPPIIEDNYDIITMFGHDKGDLLTIFSALFAAFGANSKLGQAHTPGGPASEVAGWAIGQIRGRNPDDDYDWQNIESVATRALRMIAGAIPLEQILEIIRPYFIKPVMRQAEISARGQKYLDVFVPQDIYGTRY
jgi:hypothetical protein